MLPARRENRESKYTKNVANKASMSLKAKSGVSNTNPKRSENEAELAARCGLCAQYSAFLTPHTSFRPPGTGNAVGFEIARVQETRRTPRKYKNRGNEAKERLKTKDITLLSVQIMRVLRANSHRSNAEMSKNGPHSAKRSQGTRVERQGGQRQKVG